MANESIYYGGKETINNINGKYVTTTQFNTLVEAVQALQTSVGSSSSGLVKDVTDLKTAVGGNDSGLVKDVADLKTVVGDSSSGLVKRVADLEAE